MYFIGAIFSVLFCLFSTILFISFSVLPGVGRERGAKIKERRFLHHIPLLLFLRRYLDRGNFTGKGAGRK
jgi:hypothetical protein